MKLDISPPIPPVSPDKFIEMHFLSSPLKTVIPPPPPIHPDKDISSDMKSKKPHYVPRDVLNDLSASLDLEMLNALPYEDNGRITFEDLVVFLSKKDNKEIHNAKTDEQIVDKQIDILFDIKNEAKKAMSNGNTSGSRQSIANYIRKRLDVFDELANKASFNNRPLNKQENDLKIGITRSDNIGNTRFATGANILEPNKVSLSFLDSNNNKVNIREVEINNKHNTGLGVLSEAINDNYDKLNIKALWNVQSTGEDVVKAGKISNLIINDIRLGTINDIDKYDADGRLIAAINNITDQTGVRGSIDARGHLVLTSIDGKGITIEADEGMELLSLDTQAKKHSNYGKLTLLKHNSTDIKMVDNNEAKYIGFSKDDISESTINLRDFKRTNYNAKEAFSIGVSPNNNSLVYAQIKQSDSYPSSVMTYRSALIASDIFDSSIIQLQEIRNTLNTDTKSSAYGEDKTNKGLLVSKSV